MPGACVRDQRPSADDRDREAAPLGRGMRGGSAHRPPDQSWLPRRARARARARPVRAVSPTIPGGTAKGRVTPVVTSRLSGALCPPSRRGKAGYPLR